MVSRKASSQSGHERRLRANAYVPAAMSAAMAMKTRPSRAKLTGLRSRVLQGKRRPGDATEGVEVATTRRLHDLRWKRRRRRLPIPAAGPPLSVEIVAQGLLVEARLRPARLVLLGRRETRAIGCQYFVDQPDRAGGVAPELELRVCDDDAASRCDVAAARVDEPAHRLERIGHTGAEPAA